jgi:hypothetical protein
MTRFTHCGDGTGGILDIGILRRINRVQALWAFAARCEKWSSSISPYLPTIDATPSAKSERSRSSRDNLRCLEAASLTTMPPQLLGYVQETCQLFRVRAWRFHGTYRYHFLITAPPSRKTAPMTQSELTREAWKRRGTGVPNATAFLH